METLKFNLSSNGAVFKKPHINTVNLTYSHIHKIALLGLLGAIIGLKGHNLKEKEDVFPEFYEELKGLKISILPQAPFIPKTLKDITDTSGFSNKKATFVIQEQVLLNPKWTIYIQQGDVSDELYEKLKDMLLKNWAVYIPYLGRNHYQANIDNVEIINLELADLDEISSIDSLINEKDFEFVEDFSLDDDLFEVGEYYPVRFRPFINYYIEEKMYLTNKAVELKEGSHIYIDDDKSLYFF